MSVNIFPLEIFAFGVSLSSIMYSDCNLYANIFETSELELVSNKRSGNFTFYGSVKEIFNSYVFEKFTVLKIARGYNRQLSPLIENRV